jgi:riboflavin biosynthesis pyrimidine reductase
VLDPHLRLDHRLRLLSDGRAPTIVITARTSDPVPRPHSSHVEIIAVTYIDGSLDLEEALLALRARGLGRIFIEGGGVTVSRFLEAGLLDRLQLAIAPKIMGSGALALNLPPIERMADVITARCRRFSLGADMLFDCDLRANA